MEILFNGHHPFVSLRILAFDAVEFCPLWLLAEKAESNIFPVSIPNGDRQVSLNK